MKKFWNDFVSSVKEDFAKWRASFKDKKTVRRTLWHTAVLLAVMLLCCVLTVLSISGTIVMHTSDRVSDHESIDALAAQGEQYDCILVLGCGVNDDGSPSDRLRDRVTVGVALYHAGVAPKILMSGDHEYAGYDEVSTMLSLAMEMGVPKEDVFLDHAGLSTYESIYRADYIFDCSSLVVVSQEYHLYRALYIAECFGIEAKGVSADLVPYANMLYHDLRETLARCKDLFYAQTKPEPTYLGEKIDLTGSGVVTHEE